MKKAARHLLLLGSMLMSPIAYLGAQCDAPTTTQADYCLNQKAEIRVSDADPDVRYHWYERQGLGNFTDLFYGEDGEGRYFVSNQNVSTTGTHYFHYVKEQQFTIGPNYRAPGTGGSYAMNQTSYDMTFDASMDFRLDTVTVVVEMTSPTDDYMFEIMYISTAGDTTYSLIHTAPRSDFQSLGGNLYQVRFPTVNSGLITEGISIEAGAGQKLEFRSVTAPNGTDYVSVDNVYWWGAGEYPGGNYALGTIDIFDSEDMVGTDTRTPLIMDWAITLTCDLDSIAVTQSSNCCTPVGEDVNLSSNAFQNLVQPGQLPVTLTASGADIAAGMYFYWFDANGVELGGGQDMTTWSATSTGQYTVRVVNDAADKESAACYTKTSIYLDSTNVYTNGDQFICVGEPLFLEAFGAEGNYVWTQVSGPSATINTPNSSTSSVNVTQAGTYVFQVEADVLVDDIAVDGKFEQWDDAANFDINLQPRLFETSYGRATGGPGVFIQNNGQMRIDDDIVAWSANGNSICNNLETAANGNFLYADAKTSGVAAGYNAGTNPIPTAWALEAPMWQLTNQPVAPNTDYFFSIDVANWGGGGASGSIMMLLVNGVPLDLFVNSVNQGPVYQVPLDCQWYTVSGSWNSGANTTATITVSEVAKVDQGHELAIDNITFNAGLGREVSTLTVVVDQVEDPGTNTYCEGGGVQTTLSVDGLTQYTWYEDANANTELQNSTSPGVFVDWTPPLGTTGVQTLYVQNSGTTPIAGGSGFGPAGTGGYGSNNEYGTYFTVNGAVLLESFEVEVGGASWGCPTGDMTFRITNTQTNTIANYTVTVPCTNGGRLTVPINAVLSSGTYEITATNTGGATIYQTPYIGSPATYSAAGIIEITGYEKANTEGHFFNWEVSESSACGSPAPIVVNPIVCCTQLAPTASIQTGSATICVGETLELLATPDAGTTGSITYQWYAGNSPISGATGATYTVPNTAAAAATNYSVTVTSSASCSGESPRSNTISVTINGLPEGDITVDDPTICNDGTQATVTLTATGGTGPYDFAWTEGSTPGSQNGDVDGTHDIPTTLDETYTLTSVTDDNGCTATNLGNVSVSISYLPEVTASLDALSCPNGTDPEFDISINVSGGTAPYVITAVDDLSASVSGSVSGGVWSNDTPIDEARTVTVTLTDGNGCNPVIINNLNQTCSCPETASLAITGASTVCEEGAVTQSELTITFDDGTTAGAPSPTGSTSWFFQVLDQTNAVIVDHSVASYNGMSLVIPNVDPGTYRIENLVGDGPNGCQGSEGGSQTIDLHPSPAAAISGDQSKCDDGVSTASITIDPSAGTAPMTFEYTGTVSGLLNSGATSNDPVVFTTNNVETFTLTSITDDNGCTAKAADMTGQATITGVTPPTATITSPTSDPFLTGTDDVNLSATDPGTGYTVDWSIVTGQGTIGTTNTVNTQITGLTATDPAPNSTTTVLLTVSDDGGLCADSTATIDITRVDRTVPDLGGNDTICETSGFPYVINTQPLIATIETASLTQSAGGIAVYDNVANTITIASNPGPGNYTIEWEINNSVSGTSSDVMTLTVDGAPDAAAYAGSDPEETCSETFQLDATPVVTGIGTWTYVSGPGNVVAGDENLPNARVENLVTGTTSQFMWTTSNGTCTGTSVTIDVNKLADISTAAIGMSGDLSLTLGESLTADICQSGTYNVLSSPFDAATETGVWSIVSGSSISINADNSASQGVTINSEGTTRVQWAISKTLGGCPDAEATLDITVHAAPTASVTASSTEECELTPITLTGGTLGTTDVGTWTATGVGSVASGDENLGSLNVTPGAGSTTYTYTVDNDGCAPASDSETLTINPIVSTSISALGDRILCTGVDEDFTVTVTGMNGGDVTWTGYTPNSGVQGTTFSVTGAVQGNYTVTATLTSGDQCPDQPTRTEDFSLTVVDGPTPAIAEPDTTICANASITLNGTRDNSTNVIQWFNSAGAMVGVGDVTFTSVSSADTYYYTEDNGSCDPVKSNEVTISVEQVPTAQTIEDFDVCFSTGDQLVLSGTVNTPTWSWRDNLGNTILSNQNPVNVDVTTGGTYEYTLVAEGTFCPDAEDLLTVQVRSQIVVNNVFTPNGDGINDTWNIAGIETYPEAIIRVFNKWGGSVFETFANYASSPWDGTNLNNGGALPPSTYYYVIDLADGGACGEGKEGYVELMK